jgi:hypothetical protein
MSLQSIVFKLSDWDEDSASEWLKENNIKPIKQAHETKNYIRFRISQPKGPKYYSKWVDKNKTIMMVFQSAKSGAGIIDEIGRYIRGIKMAIKGTRTNLKPSVRKFLEKHGDVEIAKIDVARRPLAQLLNDLVGAMQNIGGAQLAVSPHDKLFHLFFIMTFDDGTIARVEKNEDINITTYTPDPKDEVLDVPIKRGLTLNQMIANTIKKVGERRFYHYDAYDTNCQKWVDDMLTSNGLSNTKIKSFVLQDVSKLVPKWGQKLTQFTTDLKNRLNTVIQGEGKTKWD